MGGIVFDSRTMGFDTGAIGFENRAIRFDSGAISCGAKVFDYYRAFNLLLGGHSILMRHYL